MFAFYAAYKIHLRSEGRAQFHRGGIPQLICVIGDGFLQQIVKCIGVDDDAFVIRCVGHQRYCAATDVVFNRW